MSTSPTIIAGAGIAGLAAALALGDRDILMLEKASSFSTIGAGLQLGPNAVRALQKLGAWDVVRPITSTAPEIHMWDGYSGRLLKRLPLGRDFEQRFGAPYRLAHRGELHEALLSVVRAQPRISIHLHTEALRASTSNNNVTLETRDKTYSATALIATDGVNSPVRESLFAKSKAVDAGETYHRALIPVPDIAGVALECVNLWMYPNAHVVHYPVGKQQKLNVVAITPTASEPYQYLQHATPKLLELLSYVRGKTTEWNALSAPRLEHWTKGNILLLGDAAHGALPYLAQGAAMALEDAACLSGALARRTSLNAAFNETAFNRKPRAERLQHESLKAGRIYHMDHVARLSRNLALPFIPARMMASRLNWLYGDQSFMA